MSKSNASVKPVHLQLNNSGAWKTIVSFDAANDQVVGQVMEAAVELQRIDASARFRIASKDSLIGALMYLDKGEWRKA